MRTVKDIQIHTYNLMLKNVIIRSKVYAHVYTLNIHHYILIMEAYSLFYNTKFIFTKILYHQADH